MSRLVVLALVASLSPSRVAIAEPGEPSALAGRCAMIDAIFAIKEPGFQKFLRRKQCARAKRARKKILVEVRGPDGTTFFGANESCPKSAFAIYTSETVLSRRDHSDHAVLRLSVTPSGGDWSFGASYFSPIIADDDSGESFHDHEYYCHLVGGYVGWDGEQWRTWVDYDRWWDESKRRLEAERTRAQQQQGRTSAP